MKPLFLFLLCCFTVTGLHAATVSGTVTNTTTSMPVGGLDVYLFDTLTSYRDTATTNAAGAYSFTLPGTISAGSYLELLAYDCGSMWGQIFLYSGSSTTQNISVCNPAVYGLQGFMWLGPTAVGLFRHATVYLIRKHYDTVIGDTVLSAIDSTQVGISYVPGKFHFLYTTLPSGTLMLKAVLSPLDSSYGIYLPTYEDSALQWNKAFTFDSTAIKQGTYHQFHMVAGVNPGGPGFIGGSVILGANKPSGAGDPLEKRILLLTKSDDTPVGFSHSDANGQFSFPNIPLGTYKLFGDVLGKANPPLLITLSAGNSSVSDVLFRENRKDFSGQIGGLGIGGTNQAMAAVSLYPNPAGAVVELRGLAAIEGSKTVTLSTVSGAVIARYEVAAGQNIQIPTASLANGLYILDVRTLGGMLQLKFTK